VKQFLWGALTGALAVWVARYAQEVVEIHSEYNAEMNRLVYGSETTLVDLRSPEEIARNPFPTSWER
jgi:hypothetical protein